MFQQVSLI